MAPSRESSSETHLQLLTPIPTNGNQPTLSHGLIMGILDKAPYILNNDEVETLQRGMEDPDYITGYWLAPETGEPGFFFDYNFTDKGAWQKRMHMSSQSTVVIIGGIGTGKTLGVGMSAVVWCLTTESFRFLNVAQKEWQARLMYDLVLERAEGTPLARLISSAPQRPYPKIIFRFQIGARIYQSMMEFMSVDRDARGIFSWRGDWINVEEAGLLDNLDEIALNLSTRLSGTTKRGRSYVGRFSFISNPWDTPHLWYLFDLASGDPENNLSMVLSTRENKNVSDDQITQMLKHIPPDERSRFLDGLRPEGKGNYFAKPHIYSSEDSVADEVIRECIEKEKPGYLLQDMQGCGVISMEQPRLPGRIYFLLGDPGSDNAPSRNAPVLMVWDVTDFPNSPMRLVAFWWGFGFGRITPFIDKLTEYKSKYKPMFSGIDSTGPQKSLAELLNIQFAEDGHISEDQIGGLDFSGPKKMAYLVAARLTLESGLTTWPKCITGMRAQLSNYDPAKDRAGGTKIPQDIVACYAMSCFVVRTYFNVTLDDLQTMDSAYIEAGFFETRDKRLRKNERNRRAPSHSETRGKSATQHQ